MWDAQQYLRFGDERARPFFELIARIGATGPGYVADLGCGPGNLTSVLATRWPGAEVVGVDNSPEMIAAAASASEGGRPRLQGAGNWGPAVPRDHPRDGRSRALARAARQGGAEPPGRRAARVHG